MITGIKGSRFFLMLFCCSLILFVDILWRFDRTRPAPQKGVEHLSCMMLPQVDRSFEVTNAHQFKDPEFKAATQELLKDFQQDLKESWRRDATWKWYDWKDTFRWRVLSHRIDLREKRGFAEFDRTKNLGYSEANEIFERLGRWIL